MISKSEDRLSHSNIAVKANYRDPYIIFPVNQELLVICGLQHKTDVEINFFDTIHYKTKLLQETTSFQKVM